MSEEVDVKPPVLLPVFKTETEPIERPASPETNCAICLEEFNNKSFTNSCLHEFCYLCLKEWSKIKPECPLCKQRFQTIIHNIRSPGDYDEYQVEANDPLGSFILNFEAHTSQRFPYSNALEFRERLQRHRDLYPPSTTMTSMVLVRPSAEVLRHENSIVSIRYLNDYNTNTTFRRNVYRQNRWVRPASPSRVRECSPEFYRLNPAQTHRLVPWLFRELHVLLDVAIDPNELLNCILQLISVYPIRSTQFREALEPTMGTHTDHFIHEFYHFAISPHDIIAYDSLAEYDPSREAYFDPAVLFGVISDDEDSDIEIVQPLIPNRSSHDDSHCGLDLTNRAGPSSAAYVRPSEEEIIEIPDSSSDSEVEIIHVRPPTPVVITIDSTSEEEDVLEVSNLSTLEPPDADLPSTSRESTPPMPCLRPIRITRTRDRKRHRIHNSSYSSSSSSSPSPSRCRSSTRSRSRSSSQTSSSSSTTSSSSDSDYRHNRSSHRNKKRKRVSHTRKGKSVSRKRRTRKCRVNIEGTSSSDE